MAERRMFAKTIVDSDAFLSMPVSTQLLYFHLAMRADDDGFINQPKAIMRVVGAKDDDFNVLFAKKFLLPFESGVVVVKHWRMHNYIRSDRYQATKYSKEKAMLSLDENNSYTLGIGIPLNESKKEKKPLTEAQQKRLDAKKESDLPYSFEYKIKQAFVGEQCPVCGLPMKGDREFGGDEHYPSIQHNKPISKGGKHELGNISVICKKCNYSIQDNETDDLNADLVAQKWDEIQNNENVVAGMDTEYSIGKVSIGKSSIEKNSKEVSNNNSDLHFMEQLNKDTKKNTTFEELERLIKNNFLTPKRELTEIEARELFNWINSYPKNYLEHIISDLCLISTDKRNFRYLKAVIVKAYDTWSDKPQVQTTNENMVEADLDSVFAELKALKEKGNK
jgi:hypothetical protein